MREEAKEKEQLGGFSGSVKCSAKKNDEMVNT